jgi:purine-binding chemotaxis protein CheW
MDFLRIRQKARERARASQQPPIFPHGEEKAGESSDAAAVADRPFAPEGAEQAEAAPVAEHPLAPEGAEQAEAALVADHPLSSHGGERDGERSSGADLLPSWGEAPGARPSGEGATIEEALRAELHGGTDEGGAASALLSPEPVPDDPLDDFFWREDETAPLLPDIVATIVAAPAEPVEVRREWLTFQLASESYGIEIEHVREILKAPQLTEIPRGPEHVLGVLMVRGEVIAVFDPRRRLGLPPGEPDRRARLIVCDFGTGPRGLLVDAVSHVVRLVPSSIEPRPGGIGGASAEYIVGIGRDRSQLVVLLDLPTLLADPSPSPGREARS